MKPVILFAGQGSQAPGMGLDFYEKSEKFRQIFDILGEERKKIAFEGPMEVLSDTRYTQPCMVAFGVGVFAIIKEMLNQAGVRPLMMAGLSLGEYSALQGSGVFTAKEAIELVTLRGQAMHNAALGITCGMSAVLQLDREVLAECCQEASDLGKVEIANYNCPGQIVIAGEKAAVDKAGALALERGAKRCLPLTVSGPFHTSFMEPAGKVLAQRFEAFDFGDMEIPVAFNAVGRTLQDGETIAQLLVKQVQSSVYFEDTLKFMEAAGADTFIEIGPGKALTGFVKKTCKNAECFTINTMADIEALSERLRGV